MQYVVRVSGISFLVKFYFHRHNKITRHRSHLLVMTKIIKGFFLTWKEEGRECERGMGLHTKCGFWHLHLISAPPFLLLRHLIFFFIFFSSFSSFSFTYDNANSSVIKFSIFSSMIHITWAKRIWKSNSRALAEVRQIEWNSSFIDAFLGSCILLVMLRDKY